MDTEQVFLSYAKRDFDFANRLYRELTRRGVKLWFDHASLRPGENWQVSIKKAIRESRFFLALLSNNSVNHIGYVQKELKLGIGTLDLFPETDIYIIPIRLDICEPTHDRLKDLHWLDLFPENSYVNGIQRILNVVSPTRKAFRSTFQELSMEEVISITKR